MFPLTNTSADVRPCLTLRLTSTLVREIGDGALLSIKFPSDKDAPVLLVNGVEHTIVARDVVKPADIYEKAAGTSELRKFAAVKQNLVVKPRLDKAIKDQVKLNSITTELTKKDRKSMLIAGENRKRPTKRKSTSNVGPPAKRARVGRKPPNVTQRQRPRVTLSVSSTREGTAAAARLRAPFPSVDGARIIGRLGTLESLKDQASYKAPTLRSDKDLEACSNAFHRKYKVYEALDRELSANSAVFKDLGDELQKTTDPVKRRAIDKHIKDLFAKRDETKRKMELKYRRLHLELAARKTAVASYVKAEKLKRRKRKSEKDSNG